MKVGERFLFVGMYYNHTMARKHESKKSDIVSLFEIKNLIEMSSLRLQRSGSGTNIARIHEEMRSLNKKFDDLKDVVVGIKKRGESPRKIAMKKEIISLLKEHKRLNPGKLASLIGLSRVRANEYLRELEEERIAKGIIINKKRFYMLEEDLSKKAVPDTQRFEVVKPSG